MFCITKSAFDRARHALRGKAHRGGEREGEYMRRRRQLKFVAVITALAGAVTAAVVLATPGSGILSAPVVASSIFPSRWWEMPLGMTRGFRPICHIRCFMYRLTVVIVVVKRRRGQLMR